MRIILFTDAHYARGLPPSGGRMYAQGLNRLRRVAHLAGAADAFINLGDLVNDAGSPELNAASVRDALAALGALGAPCYSLAGNHDAEVAPKRDFTGHEDGAWALEMGGLEWLMLDSNYTSAGASYRGFNFDWRDAALPAGQLNWLRAQLSRPGPPLVILSHHPLCGDISDPHVIRNAPEVASAILGARRPVRALIQGHYHPGARRALGGIPSYIVPALCMGERCSYAALDARGGRLDVRLLRA